MLKELGEKGDLICEGIGCSTGGRSICQLADSVGTSKFHEHEGNAGLGVAEVVGVLAANGLEGRAEFAAPVFAGSKIDIGEKHDGKLGVVDGNPIQLHSPCFGAEDLHVGVDVF